MTVAPESDEPRDTVPLSHYSKALDEIYELRTLLAYESLVTKAHLGYKTFPKSRRPHAEEQIKRMQRAARGDIFEVNRVLSFNNARILQLASVPQTLTRWAWEKARGLS